ncbi:ABC transporter permease subunit [Treponema sp. OttesenSCG-928-L16]|nr:ABC transporter permease subunit [Treponema sp. OttesenSCG-928-L16]
MNSRKLLIAQLNRYKYIYLLFLPAFLFAFVFSYMPMYGIQIAFRDYRFFDGFLGSKFVGLKHFIRMFNEPTFLAVMRNTVIISFLKIVIVFPGGILFAIFLNEITNHAAKKIYQTISYLPHFLSWIVLAGIIREFTDLEGPINMAIEFFGGTPQLFLTKPIPFISTLIISDLWHAVGWNSIIYLAAISGISKELYESADMDGAGRIRKMVSITFPSILPVVFIMFILRLGHVMNAGFDQILNLYNPLVYSIADIIDTYVYRVGLMHMNFSYSTAIGLFKNLIGLTLVLTTNALSRRMEGAL